MGQQLQVHHQQEEDTLQEAASSVVLSGQLCDANSFQQHTDQRLLLFNLSILELALGACNALRVMERVFILCYSIIKSL